MVGFARYRSLNPPYGIAVHDGLTTGPREAAAALAVAAAFAIAAGPIGRSCIFGVAGTVAAWPAEPASAARTAATGAASGGRVAAGSGIAAAKAATTKGAASA